MRCHLGPRGVVYDSLSVHIWGAKEIDVQVWTDWKTLPPVFGGLGIRRRCCVARDELTCRAS